MEIYHSTLLLLHAFLIFQVSDDSEVLPEDDDGAQARASRIASALQVEQRVVGPERVVVIVSHCDFLGMLARCLLQLHPSTPGGYWELNNAATAHIVLPRSHVNAASSSGVDDVSTACDLPRLLHWNRSDHFAEALRSGISWKQVSVCSSTRSAAAQWVGSPR